MLLIGGNVQSKFLRLFSLFFRVKIFMYHCLQTQSILKCFGFQNLGLVNTVKNQTSKINEDLKTGHQGDKLAVFYEEKVYGRSVKLITTTSLGQKFWPLLTGGRQPRFDCKVESVWYKKVKKYHKSIIVEKRKKFKSFANIHFFFENQLIKIKLRVIFFNI